jgi:hypothetical protein
MFYSKEDAESIFAEAKVQSLTKEGYVWIVSEQAMHAVNVTCNTMFILSYFKIFIIIAGSSLIVKKLQRLFLTDFSLDNKHAFVQGLGLCCTKNATFINI